MNADKGLYVLFRVWFWSDGGWDLFSPGQEDGCLSSGPKRMMKGTAYLVGAAACM